MSKIEITGAKLVGGLFCHYAYREDIGKNRHDYHKGVKSERPVHEDLVNAFKALGVHLPVILQDIEPGQIEDINSDVNNFKGTEAFLEMLKKYTVVEVVREIEEGRAQLIGTKSLDLGILGVETPMIRYEGEYFYKLEYQFAIDRLMREVLLYREGKQAPEAVQPELFDIGQDMGEDGEPKEKKKRGRPKKDVIVTATGPDGEEREVDLEKVKDPNDGDDTTEPLSNFQRDPADVADMEF